MTKPITAMQPRRRWYQFGLSTLLVLVAILCWSIAVGPKISFERQGGRSPYRSLSSPEAWVIYFGVVRTHYSTTLTEQSKVVVVLPTAIIWPAFALLGFIAWKIGWTITERRKHGLKN